LQLAIVTGGARRIGKAVALALAEAGFSIALQYRRSADAAAETVEALRQLGVTALAFEAALDEPGSAWSFMQQVGAALGPVACLVNNASHFADDRLPTLTEESWRSHLSVNLEAPVFLAQAFARQLPQDRQGNIVNILDQRVLRPNPLFFSYTVAKSALWAATRTMAQALAPRVRVNAIAPGPTLKSVYQSEAEFEREWREMPLGHGTTPEEIGQAVLFLLRSPAITGQTIALDGGQHLMWQTPDIRAT
jgi:NAD(P)-dependent dehydrogenase (short-subunit alcohol dehydrogenase family)